MDDGGGMVDVLRSSCVLLIDCVMADGGLARSSSREMLL